MGENTEKRKSKRLCQVRQMNLHKIPSSEKERSMRKIKWLCETGYAGCNHEGEIEVDDDATDKEIDEAVLNDVCNYVNWSWREEE